MKSYFFTGIMILAICFVPIVLAGQIQKNIVGYYPNWQWYDRSGLVDPEALFYEKYTVINYAFFNPQASGDIVSTDAWADENLLLGPMIWWPVVTHDSTKSLPWLAHEAGVKVLPSIGGWSLSGNFPAIAANPVKRQTFANACVELIETYHFDGIDLDWEYPGYAPQGGTPDDKQNFTLLLQEIRSALDALENQTGQEYLLTSCFGASQNHYENIEWENVLPLLDMVNLMTYDFHGSWDELSNHNTPLFAPAVGDPDWCFHRAYQILHEDFGVPAEKINVGLAFYGKSLANCTQLFGTHSGYDASTFWEDEGVPTYFNIQKRMSQFTRYWDDQAKCPYLLGNSINTFVTYDDCESIGWKAQYVKNHDIAGVIIWEITGDYIETTTGSGVIAGTPLLDTVHTIFDMVTTHPEIPRTGACLFPNPASSTVKIVCDQNILDITILSLTGNEVPTTFDRNLIDLKNLARGIYFVKITTSNSSNISKLIVQ